MLNIINLFRRREKPLPFIDRFIFVATGILIADILAFIFFDNQRKYQLSSVILTSILLGLLIIYKLFKSK